MTTRYQDNGAPRATPTLRIEAERQFEAHAGRVAA
jgi:hypothetical protein